ncbi:hypothetical protein [Allomuricauda sp. NBRC 101325]|uniref:hypothetical protein n=1 Tax=Allomuricauda sp. NBRC 101325 TaxID=1113758 RepID=UPI0024A41C10|nr:hypothetical protein [Muricauda sp. NBRC 101325]GLU43661.1 hypothetical protein Musp01_12850 [Muricauda sp. NBRC 101325]
MKKIFAFILLTHCLSAIYGQKNNSNLRSGQMYNYHPILSSNTNAFQTPDKKIDGTRFVLNDFANNGKVFVSGKVYITKGLNIDAFNNDVVFKLNNDSILILEKSVIDSLSIGGHKFKKQIDNNLHEVLWQKGNATLFKTFFCQIQKGHTNVMKGTTENDKYKLSHHYYLKKDEAIVKSFDLGTKSILSLFGDKQKQVKKYIKYNNLNMKDEKDVIKVISYFF